MKEMPDTADIVSTVRDFLARIGPSLEKGAKFEAQVATYLLDMVQRELKSPRETRGDERELCTKIRSGSCDAQWDALVRAQLDAAIARVRIVRPGYLDNEAARVP
jgi:hypothetical protein